MSRWELGEMSVPTAKDFAKPFIEAGVFPPNVRRMIIDAEVGKGVKVYYDTFASPKLLEVITPQMLMDAEPIQCESQQGGVFMRECDWDELKRDLLEQGRITFDELQAIEKKHRKE
jgi:hypothetical protein